MHVDKLFERNGKTEAWGAHGAYIKDGVPTRPTGKTAREKASGKWARTLAHKAERSEANKARRSVPMKVR